MTHSQAISATQQWVDEVVVGLNFCPFAKREVVNRSIRYLVCDSASPEQALQFMLSEVYFLDSNPQWQTSLLLFPAGFNDFTHYLDLAAMADSLIEQSGYAGIFQLATFHPHYCFAHEQADDPANYTNRAPFPTLHLIREASIERALKTYKNPQAIPQINMDKARTLGKKHFTTLLKRIYQSHHI